MNIKVRFTNIKTGTTFTVRIKGDPESIQIVLAILRARILSAAEYTGIDAEVPRT